MDIRDSKRDELKRRMERLGITGDNLIEKFILGSGSGGQKVNKTHSCVYLKHIPTGNEVKCQQERSRELNRFLARRKLCERLEEELFNEMSKKKREEQKIRQQKKRRSRRQKEKMLEEKRQHSEKKQLRKPPSLDS